MEYDGGEDRDEASGEDQAKDNKAGSQDGQPANLRPAGMGRAEDAVEEI